MTTNTTTEKPSRKGTFLLVLAALSILIAVVAWSSSFGKPILVVAFSGLAVGVYLTPLLRSFAFTAWLIAGVSAAMCFPHAFGQWGELKLSVLIVPLVQLVMFGMGTTLSLRDFTRVFTVPWPVIVGMLLQFTVMPISGYLIARSFGFEGEVAAGIILVGSCSGGVASNLMTYLAGANVALSVTMTCFSTLLSPMATPFAMKLLAGQFIEIDFTKMMFSILNMIIVPVVAGLIAHTILYGKQPYFNTAKGLLGFCAGAAALAILISLLPNEIFGQAAIIQNGAILGIAMLAIIAAIKWIVRLVFKGPENWMEKTLPTVSMLGIWLILIIITAQTRDKLLTIGGMLIIAAMIHNAIGYLGGYWGCKTLGKILGLAGFLLGLRETAKTLIPESDCRTVAFEVGMQNGGMATGLAMQVLKSPTAALPPNVFGTWMNVSGSLLANWWKRKSNPSNTTDSGIQD